MPNPNKKMGKRRLAGFEPSRANLGNAPVCVLSTSSEMAGEEQPHWEGDPSGCAHPPRGGRPVTHTGDAASRGRVSCNLLLEINAQAAASEVLEAPALRSLRHPPSSVSADPLWNSTGCPREVASSKIRVR